MDGRHGGDRRQQLTVPQVNMVDMRRELCHFPGNEPGEGSAMSGRKMDRAAAERFVAAWCASWRRVDIDAVVAHFADDAQMRSPLALSLTGSPVVTGAENIRAYWREAYGHIESADLNILSWSWDEAIARLTVWWQLGDTRASEFMDFDDAGRVVRSEAFYGK
ncbi:YybH family protein [Bradyrhizobium japonicum]|nr:nuclear transport factor 2 family protein [Bradyrhizobium japonicum]